MPFDALAWMLVGHAVADYPLQGNWLSAAKNPAKSLVPGEVIWPGALACHAAIHAGAVQLATESWALAGAEFICHAAVDYAKCKGLLTYNADQALHVICKLFWWCLLTMMVS